MADIDAHAVLLNLPSDLAFDLMEAEVVEPYMRLDRIDSETITTLVLAAGTAASTVVATKLSEGTMAAIAKAVRNWFRQHRERGKPTLIAPDGASLAISEHTTEAEIAEFIRHARANQ